MQGTTTMLRTGTRLLLVVLTAFVLVALGGTGARACPSVPAPPAATMPAAGVLAANPAQDPAPQAVGSSAMPAGQPALVEQTELEQTTCNPGRKKVRLESVAVVPSFALLQHTPDSERRLLPRTQAPGPDGVRTSGRIPVSLTHLDLGIVRT